MLSDKRSLTTISIRTVTSLLLFAASACSSERPGEDPVAVTQQALRPYLHFGTRCQDDYQNGWAVTWSTYGMCNDFNNGIRQYTNFDVIDFYYNLHGAQADIQTTSDTCLSCGGADSVDFFFIATHGNFNSTSSALAMWDQGVSAWTSQMRLGDNGKQLSVFAAYSCLTMSNGDGHLFTRWYPPFAGGLKIAVGAYGNVYDGNDQKGTEFATRIEQEQQIGFSWNEAVWYADNNNQPLSLASGANSTDCWNRHPATLTSVQTLPRLRDGAIGYFCWSNWSG